MDAICLDHLSLCDLPALDLIAVAGELGCGAVSLFVTPLPLGPYADLVNDAGARREVVAALRDTGLGVGIVEPFMLDAAPDWDTMERTAALAAELGGDVNALAFDDDPSRQRDSMARLAGICRAAGTRMTIEAFSMSRARTQADSLALAEHCGPDVGVTVDTLHVIRTGGTWADVAALPQERIFHVQLNDGPLAAPDDLGAEAVRYRHPPGQGEFDLDALVPLLPATARIAVEAPFVAPAGSSPLERGRILVDATRALLARAGRA
ncbi:MAG: TIM barrel protein [Novosphingobium sp.]|nr:TIM barrel protein [Novosphingobium sp.]